MSFQANYFYQTEVPSKAIGNLGVINFGNHNNYGIGPVLTYTVFDNHKTSKSAESYNFMAMSKKTNYLVQKKKLELKLRQVYFRSQYALRELTLTAKALKTSAAQERDINIKLRAGSSSQLDQTEARRDVISYQLKYRQAQTQLTNFLRELISLTGVGDGLDTSGPVPNELFSEIPKGGGDPTLRIILDPIESTVNKFSILIKANNRNAPTDVHPELQTLNEQTESYRLASESEKSGLWPKIQFQANSQYIYPDAIIQKSIIQNTIGVTLSMPLYEGEATRSRSATKLNEAISNEYLKKQRLSDLVQDFSKAWDMVISLRSQKVLSEQSVRDAQVVEHLTYQSYKAGKIRYLDVQDANLKLLEAEVIYAQIESSLLNEIAMLDYLNTDKE